MFCRKCNIQPPDDDQSLASCVYCDEDLSKQKQGTNLCKACADSRQLCQGCGQSLRLGDFKGVFVDAYGKLGRGDERKVIALILKSRTLDGQ